MKVVVVLPQTILPLCGLGQRDRNMLCTHTRKTIIVTLVLKLKTRFKTNANVSRESGSASENEQLEIEEVVAHL